MQGASKARVLPAQQEVYCQQQSCLCCWKLSFKVPTYQDGFYEVTQYFITARISFIFNAPLQLFILIGTFVTTCYEERLTECYASCISAVIPRHCRSAGNSGQVSQILLYHKALQTYRNTICASKHLWRHDKVHIPPISDYSINTAGELSQSLFQHSKEHRDFSAVL